MGGRSGNLQGAACAAACALVALGWYLVAIRALNMEAEAVVDAGGDAGLYGVGLILLTAFLLPPALLLVVAATVRGSLAASVMSGGSALALAAVAILVGRTMTPMDRRPERGVRVPLATATDVDRAYQLGAWVLGVAAALAVVAVLVERRPRGRAPVSVSGP